MRFVPATLFCLLLMESVSAAGPATQPASAPDASANWPGFRGPNPCGPAPAGGDPLVTIDPARDVRFKVAVPAEGQSSVIIWGDRIFLTGQGNRIMAFNRADGKGLWNVALDAPEAIAMPGDKDFKVEDDEHTGSAAPTAVTDGRFVYAFFGTSVLGCVDFAGKQVWAQRLVPGKPRNSYGLAASPVLYDDLLIQQVDLGKQPDDNLSFIVAVRAKDGVEVWRQDRLVRSGWTTPVIVKLAEGDTLVTSGAPLVIAYDPKTGAERWKAGKLAVLEEGPKLSGDVAASPIVCGQVVIAPAGEDGELLAVKAGGKGDVTKTRVAWSTNEIPRPDVASPVSDGKQYFHVSNTGDMYCLDPATGQEVWRAVMKGQFWSSPVLVKDRIYAINAKGVVFVVSTDGKVLATNPSLIGEKERVTTTPAILDGRIYVRTSTHLMCIGRP